MALAPGEARKDLSADALFESLRSRFASLPDPRSGEVEIPLADALMSAFAMFSLKDPSLLAFDHRRHNPNDNFRTIYGINRVPCDSQMRDILDPIDPANLRAPFREVFRRLQRGQVLKRFVYLDGHYLLSLDGTTYFSSSEIHCSSCLEKHHRNGSVTYSHQLLVLQRHVRQLSMTQVVIVQEFKSFLRISIRTWLMDQNPCETNHFLAIGVLTQR